jgi:poly(3-hydroxybutyrate) depolymerase
MKVIFKPIFLSCALVVCSSFAWSATVKDLEIKADGQTWTYHLHVPLQARSGGAPLVVVFHGAGGNGKDYLIKNGWVALSEKEGLIVAAPEGLSPLPSTPVALLRATGSRAAPASF